MIVMRMEGERQVKDAFARIQGGAARKDLLEQIGASMVASTQQRFLEQRDPDGKAWLPSGRARAEGGQTLRDTARLFQSITFQASDKDVEWGSNVIYAAIHQFGGEIRARSGGKLKFAGSQGFVSVDKVDMPARPFLGMSDEDQAEISAIVNDWFSEAFQ